MTGIGAFVVKTEKDALDAWIASEWAFGGHHQREIARWLGYANASPISSRMGFFVYAYAPRYGVDHLQIYDRRVSLRRILVYPRPRPEGVAINEKGPAPPRSAEIRQTEFRARNQEMWRRKMLGERTSDLADFYGLSRSRVGEIIEQVGRRRRHYLTRRAASARPIEFPSDKRDVWLDYRIGDLL